MGAQLVGGPTAQCCPVARWPSRGGRARLLPTRACLLMHACVCASWEVVGWQWQAVGGMENTGCLLTLPLGEHNVLPSHAVIHVPAGGDAAGRGSTSAAAAAADAAASRSQACTATLLLRLHCCCSRVRPPAGRPAGRPAPPASSLESAVVEGVAAGAGVGRRVLPLPALAGAGAVLGCGHAVQGCDGATSDYGVGRQDGALPDPAAGGAGVGDRQLSAGWQHHLTLIRIQEA